MAPPICSALDLGRTGTSCLTLASGCAGLSFKQRRRSSGIVGGGGGADGDGRQTRLPLSLLALVLRLNFVGTCGVVV